MRKTGARAWRKRRCATCPTTTAARTCGWWRATRTTSCQPVRLRIAPRQARQLRAGAAAGSRRAVHQWLHHAHGVQGRGDERVLQASAPPAAPLPRTGALSQSRVRTRVLFATVLRCRDGSTVPGHAPVLRRAVEALLCPGALVGAGCRRTIGGQWCGPRRQEVCGSLGRHVSSPVVAPRSGSWRPRAPGACAHAYRGAPACQRQWLAWLVASSKCGGDDATEPVRRPSHSAPSLLLVVGLAGRARCQALLPRAPTSRTGVEGPPFPRLRSYWLVSRSSWESPPRNLRIHRPRGRPGSGQVERLRTAMRGTCAKRTAIACGSSRTRRRR